MTMSRVVMLCCCMIMATVPLLAAHDGGVDQCLELPNAYAVPLVAHQSVESSPKGVENWVKELPHAKPNKMTRLHFYVHDTITAKNGTAILIASATNTATDPSVHYGETYAMDDPVTVVPDLDSEVIGRAQGTFTFVSLTEPVLSMKFDVVFTQGKYNGSSLSFVGNNPISHEYRELPVVGGTGAFRLVSGIATSQTYTVDIAKLNDILEYTVIVQH